MLMRNPEHQVASALEVEHSVDQPNVVHTSREMLLGQIILILLFALAILLRTIV